MSFPEVDNAAVLRSRGVSPSLQRVKILDNLRSRCDHPRVDQIYSDLLEGVPTLSRTTVYNTLKLFVAKGLVQEIIIEGNEVRYDFDISLHAHFRCDGCGKVLDAFDPDIGKAIAGAEAVLPEGTTIRERHIYFKGLCPEVRSSY